MSNRDERRTKLCWPIPKACYTLGCTMTGWQQVGPGLPKCLVELESRHKLSSPQLSQVHEPSLLLICCWSAVDDGMFMGDTSSPSCLLFWSILHQAIGTGLGEGAGLSHFHVLSGPSLVSPVSSSYQYLKSIAPPLPPKKFPNDHFVPSCLVSSVDSCTHQFEQFCSLDPAKFRTTYPTYAFIHNAVPQAKTVHRGQRPRPS